MIKWILDLIVWLFLFIRFIIFLSIMVLGGVFKLFGKGNFFVGNWFIRSGMRLMGYTGDFD